jgi:hypothetical protein
MTFRDIGPSCAQVHEDGGDALTAVLRCRVDLVIEKVVVRVVLLAHLCGKTRQLFETLPRWRTATHEPGRLQLRKDALCTRCAIRMTVNPPVWRTAAHLGLTNRDGLCESLLNCIANWAAATICPAFGNGLDRKQHLMNI